MMRAIFACRLFMVDFGHLQSGNHLAGIAQ
jgi:hypothetical protein